MGSLLVLAGVTAVVFTWLRAARRSRLRWLEKLDLPGNWQWSEHEGTLELMGGLSEGRYCFKENGAVERGRWELEGHSLVTLPEAGLPRSYDLRFFDDGKIGLDGAGRERRIYVKTPSNVVPLRRRH